MTVKLNKKKLGAIKPRDIKYIAKIGYGQICPR
jgi:hypothetical protein